MLYDVHPMLLLLLSRKESSRHDHVHILALWCIIAQPVSALAEIRG